MKRLLPFVVAILFGTAASRASPPSVSVDVAAADNAFGFQLLNAVQKASPDGNVILSPVSAALDLSMALNGADGQTRQEILSVLSLSASDLDAVNTANAQLIHLTRTPVRSVILSVADSLWVDSRFARFQDDYVRQVQASYDATPVALDFSNPSSASRINTWVSKETHGAIPKIIDQMDSADLAILLNAVYFKGEWAHKFDKAQTKARDFTRADGSIRQVSRMKQSGRFDYFETPHMQAIRLPFGDGDLVMEVLLPAKSSSVAALEEKLTREQWTAWQPQYLRRSGTIELPKFELRAKYGLKGPLQSLGMRRAFDPHGAQLAGMFSPAPGQPLTARFFISSVLQSIYWKVDEEGAEAAAVTSIGVRTTAVARPEQPFEMIVDRPFFCAIEDKRSGALLFVGAIYDPGA